MCPTRPVVRQFCLVGCVLAAVSLRAFTRVRAVFVRLSELGTGRAVLESQALRRFERPPNEGSSSLALSSGWVHRRYPPRPLHSITDGPWFSDQGLRFSAPVPRARCLLLGIESECQGCAAVRGMRDGKPDEHGPNVRNVRASRGDVDALQLDGGRVEAAAECINLRCELRL